MNSAASAARYVTPSETFALVLVAEEPSEITPEGRTLVELRDVAGELVSLVNLDGEDVDAIEGMGRKAIRFAEKIVEALLEWNLPGCRVEFS